MESNNQNLNTGAKGTFPGSSTNIAPPNSNSIDGQLGENKDALNSKTFFNLELKNSEDQVIGVIEIDLISFREKGQESRYLSLATVGVVDGATNQSVLSIDNEADFNKFKKFISELDWND